MAKNIAGKFKGNWKSILWGLIPLAIVAIVFAIPFKTVPVQTVEKYWDTEMRSEPYAVTESYTEDEPYVEIETRTENIYDSYVYTGNWSHSFEVEKPNSTVTIKFYGYSYYPQYYYLSCPGDEASSCFSWPYYWGEGRSKATIKVSYPEEVTKYRTVIKQREVTKYREVPTQVLKERKVTEYVKMSIWQYLFM